MTLSLLDTHLPFPALAEFETITDPETGVRHYQRNGGPWRVSVTTVLGIIAKGFAYDNWIAGQERDKHELAIAQAVLEPVAPEYLLSAVKARVGKSFAYRTARDEAADLGSSVHDAVRAFLSAELHGHAPPIPTLTPEGLVGFSAFVAFWRQADLEPVAMEQPLEDTELNVAGTLDVAVRKRSDNSHGILDLKNTKWVSNGYHLQVAQYLKMAQPHGNYRWGQIVKLPKGGRPFELVDLGKRMFCGDRTIQQLQEGFRHALGLWRCVNREAA